ncbi:hypothetical protein CDAR_97611 [Caerostris darwini]|uniref:Uncharacterized protein n=1 Tax=Caerostris darwini TaxID=1538125 RepID=A0AAV4NEY5_9ARAC|nr:hypothetical protein CDAR_97611 [Caerostris darwini]
MGRRDEVPRNCSPLRLRGSKSAFCLTDLIGLSQLDFSAILAVGAFGRESAILAMKKCEIVLRNLELYLRVAHLKLCQPPSSGSGKTTVSRSRLATTSCSCWWDSCCSTVCSHETGQFVWGLRLFIDPRRPEDGLVWGLLERVQMASSMDGSLDVFRNIFGMMLLVYLRFMWMFFHTKIWRYKSLLCCDLALNRNGTLEQNT